MIALQVFIGHDSRQPVAAAVCGQSISRRSALPVSITYLHLNQLPVQRRGLTEFTYSRFLVPFLCRYEGLSLFVDSDVLCLGDVCDLLAYPIAYPETPVFVVKHESKELKFEWASLMLFNNAKCKALSPEYIRDESNKLFDVAWATNVGELPKVWNHLVGYDAFDKDAKLIHYTQGIPIWPETRACDYATEWQAEYAHLRSTCSFQTLMGSSVHVPKMQHVKVK